MNMPLPTRQTMISAALLLLLPIAAFALTVPDQPAQDAFTIEWIINKIIDVVWNVFLAGVVVFFIIIGVLFLSNLGHPEKIAQARNALIWGVVGIMVAIVAFVIVRLIITALGAGAPPPAV